MNKRRWTENDLDELRKRNGSVTTIIGIDPGKSTGFGVYDRLLGKIAVLKTLDFWLAYHSVLAYKPCKTRVVIEVPNTKAQFGGKKSHTRSVNIGFVIREAQLLAQGLRDKGYDVKEVHPCGKVNAERFRQLTGYVGRTNEHSRDAGMLAFNAGAQDG